MTNHTLEPQAGSVYGTYTHELAPALTGPVAIRGARPGMTLAIRFDSIMPGSWGWSSGGGGPWILNEQFRATEPPEARMRWELDAAAMTGIQPIRAPDQAAPLHRQLRHAPAGWITFGFHEDLDQATVQAVNDMLDLMGELHGLTRNEALALASAVVDVRITQVVNGVKGVHAILPHDAIQGGKEWAAATPGVAAAHSFILPPGLHRGQTRFTRLSLSIERTP